MVNLSFDKQMKFARFLFGFILIFALYAVLMRDFYYSGTFAHYPFPLDILSIALTFPGWLMGFLLDISIGTRLYDNNAFVFLFSAITFSGIGGIIWEARLSKRAILIILLGIGGLAFISFCIILLLGWFAAMSSG